MVLRKTGESGFGGSMGLMWVMVSTALGRLGALVNGAAGFWWGADGAVGVEADGWVKGLSCGWGLLFFGGRGLGPWAFFGVGDSGVGPWFCILWSAPWIDASISADWRSSVAESCGITSECADHVFVELAVLHYQGAEEN